MSKTKVITVEVREKANRGLFYIQNGGGGGGNCLRWWKDGGHGYTSNLDEAWKVSREQAETICQSRPDEDFPWPAEKVDAAAVRHVDSGLFGKLVWNYDEDKGI
jgi:hypothetical protein